MAYLGKALGTKDGNKGDDGSWGIEQPYFTNFLVLMYFNWGLHKDTHMGTLGP